MKELSEHGVSLPPNMQGLTEEQIQELNLRDEWQNRCVPSGGVTYKKDPIGRRSGQGELPAFQLCHCSSYLSASALGFEIIVLLNVLSSEHSISTGLVKTK